MTEWAASPLLEDLEFNPVTEPAVTHELGEAPDRTRIVIQGTVRDVEIVPWAGAPVLEVSLEDGTDSVTLVFFGRRGLSGIQPGRRLAAQGTIGRHRGRRVILNPATWLHADDRAGQDVRSLRLASGRVVVDAGQACSNGSSDGAAAVP